ncbi:MAG: hypothetical protein OEL91_08715 [Burkholderiaceae bacterium]|nr:hypothetical protein [Burkholderiaceae bacterium]
MMNRQRIPFTMTALLLALASTAGLAQEMPDTMVYAEFSDPNGDTTAQGGLTYPVAYAERGNTEYAQDPSSAVGGVLTISGEFTPAKRSKWGGIGILVDNSPTPGEPGTRDMSEYTSVRVRLASDAAKTIRLRLVGPDEAVQNAGCYPLFNQTVTETLSEYTIPLSGFRPASYCGGNGRSVAATLPQLASFEVVDAPAPVTPRRVSFQVGTIEFLR